MLTMKKGLRFQTRLMLAFLLATILVAGAVILLTESKVKKTYQRQFKQKFDNEIEYLLESRIQRSEQQFAIGKKLAENEFVIKQLLAKKDVGGGSDARRKFMDSLPAFAVPKQSPVKQGGAKGKNMESRINAARSNRILAVMDLEGQIYYLTSTLEKKTASKPTGRRRAGIQRQLETLKQNGKQQIAYIPQKMPNGEAIVRDIIVTPVKHPGTGEVVGAFLMGLSSTETKAEAFLDRYHREVEDGHFENAIFLEGSLYQSSILGAFRKNAVKDHDHESEDHLFEQLEAATQRALADLPEAATDGSFEFNIHGEPHYVHYSALNPDSPLSTAWQISAFPVTELKQDLKDLRLKGSGIGLIGILIGVITALILSRNLSIPIRELSAGTRKISEGQLDLELPVRSRDEIGELTNSFNKMTADLRQKELYRSLLEKVSDESVAQAMIEGTLNPQLGGELKKVSVLFCDIRGFTHLTEAMPPEQVIELLNQHMTALTHVVREHFGVVDKFVGDEVMAVFGGLKSYGNDAANAARCAVKMIAERERLNRENGTDIQIGIGVATGEIVAGCMGSEDRLNYTVLGAKVNLGARLCGRAGAGEIVIDDQTFAEIAELSPVTQPIEGLQLKGFSSQVPAWKLTGAAADHPPLASPAIETSNP